MTEENTTTSVAEIKIGEIKSNRDVEKLLGEKAERWSDQGKNFLKLRLNGRDRADGKGHRVVAHNILPYYIKDELQKQVPEEVLKEAAAAFELTKATDEHLVIWALGRPATRARDASFQEKKAGFNEKTEEGRKQQAVSDKLAKLFDPEYGVPKVKEEKKAKAEKPKAEVNQTEAEKPKVEEKPKTEEKAVEKPKAEVKKLAPKAKAKATAATKKS